MDLVHYEAVPSSHLQGRLLDSATDNLRDVQDQAAAWLRKVILTVIPGSGAWAGRAEEAEG